MAFSGSRLAAGRLAAGLTQEQLARVMHTQQRRISDWERGMIAPRPEVIPELAEAIGLDALEFLVEDPESPSLEDMRLAAGLTMGEVGEQLGISRSRYRAMELGATRRDQPAPIVDALATAFAVPAVLIRKAIIAARP